MLQTKVADKLERTLHALTSPPGKLTVLRFLSKAKGQWNDRLEAILAPIKARCDAVGLTRGPRPADPCDVPVIPDDPASDLVITVFTGGVLVDEIVPVVRSWVGERVLAGQLESLTPFIECFTAMGKTNKEAGLSTLGASSNRSIVRESARRLSTKRLSSIQQKRSSTLPVPTTNHLTSATPAYPADTPLRLFAALYGFTPHNPEDVFRTEYLSAAQGVLLAGSPAISISISKASKDSFPPPPPSLPPSLPPPSLSPPSHPPSHPPSQREERFEEGFEEGFENGIEMTVL
jgi:hypothetical protein